jgi:hypothetical protein
MSRLTNQALLAVLPPPRRAAIPRALNNMRLSRPGELNAKAIITGIIQDPHLVKATGNTYRYRTVTPVFLCLKPSHAARIPLREFIGASREGSNFDTVAVRRKVG